MAPPYLLISLSSWVLLCRCFFYYCDLIYYQATYLLWGVLGCTNSISQAKWLPFSYLVCGGACGIVSNFCCVVCGGPCVGWSARMKGSFIVTNFICVCGTCRSVGGIYVSRWNEVPAACVGHVGARVFLQWPEERRFDRKVHGILAADGELKKSTAKFPRNSTRVEFGKLLVLISISTNRLKLVMLRRVCYVAGVKFRWFSRSWFITQSSQIQEETGL